MSGIEGWETVVGLEVHVELATETKLFCGCRNAFGSEPNTNVCPVCLGLPGSLPVLNRAAVEYAMCLGRALGCRVDASTFSRKNYFYPDMPKDYQVSQYDLPINIDGVLELPDGFRVGIERAHIEEDTGKSTHIGGGGRIHDAAYSLVDYNRAGVPLVEIVSRPDVRTADQARAYANELRGILLATGVSDARMEEGSMRVDANVSVRREGDETLGTRAEVKNLNSIRSLGRAIDYEARRQVDRLEAGERIIQETRHWNEEDGRTHTLRSKEEAYDYRYFPEPDLVPLAPDADWVNRVDAALPLLPAARRAALAAAAGVATADVATIVDRGHDELAGAAIAAGADARTVLNRVGNDLAGDLGALDAAGLTALVALETGGDLTATQAKAVLAEMVTSGRAPADIAADFGFEAMDAAALESVVDRIITDHPDDWTQFVEGDEKARGKLTGFFVGLVMKATKGQADGKAVTALLRQKAG
ncbi:MAG: Asp-tRNA(Asn)/Glu-tRNA(Gln) amidotransferase subunit GatB [Acidimicrobiales bacterium]